MMQDFPTQKYMQKEKHLLRVSWTRFGEVSLEKWRQKMDGDLPGAGAFAEQ